MPLPAPGRGRLDLFFSSPKSPQRSQVRQNLVLPQNKFKISFVAMPMFDPSPLMALDKRKKL